MLTCLSTGTSIKSVVDVNFTSIFLEIPFCSVLITSTVYVPYGKFVDGSGQINKLWLKEPSDSVVIWSNFAIVSSGAKSRIIRFSPGNPSP